MKLQLHGNDYRVRLSEAELAKRKAAWKHR